ncbi:MAG: class I SAM-dependent methyltransferase [Proteobacteria bacterium]|nr:class I SAM-dependent methyltransferase [Pseudomonadota bacterium]
MATDFARYDARHYETLSVADGYRAWSHLYDTQLDGNLDIVLLDRINSVDWSRVGEAVDLACGTGRIGAWLAEHGVTVIDGVDMTPEMMARAEAKGVYRRLLREDIRATSLPGACADLVVNCLSIGHIPDLHRAYGEVDRLLRPRGHFVLVGYHPFFLISGIPTHFKDETGCNKAIQNYVHFFSDHVTAAVQNSWLLAEMHERIVDTVWVQRDPPWRRHIDKPVSFAMVWQKPRSRLV